MAVLIALFFTVGVQRRRELSVTDDNAKASASAMAAMGAAAAKEELEYEEVTAAADVKAKLECEEQCCCFGFDPMSGTLIVTCCEHW